jgi:UDP-N-acetyl-D-glucosamine dehydrogenase
VDGRGDAVARGEPHGRHAGVLRDDPSRRHDAQPVEAPPRAGVRADGGGGLPPRVLARARPHRSRLRGPAQVPQAGRWAFAGGCAATEFYESVLTFDERDDLARPNGVWDLGSAEAAELAKLAETTYRDVNIGLANQFALFADTQGIDVYAVIEACNSQPYSHIHRPGIAVGGHCIPVYPRLYLSVDPEASIVREARSVNASMPARVVERARELLGDLGGTRVVVLGAAYRGGVKETAFSGVFPTVEALRAQGATVSVHDPLYDDDELRKLGLEPYAYGTPVDAAIVQTDHAEYRELGPDSLPGIRLLVDGRRVTEAARWTGTPRVVLGLGSDR